MGFRYFFHALMISLAIFPNISLSLSTLSESKSIFLNLAVSLFRRFLKINSHCELLLASDFSSAVEDLDYLSRSFGLLEYLHAGMYNVKTLKKIPFRRFDDIHKLSSKGSCTTVVLFLTDKKSDPTALFDLLTPSYTSICRKDEDYFFFLSPNPSILHHFLLSDKFAAKIKFKLGIDRMSKEKGEEILIKTVDFYHSLKGPELVSFPVDLRRLDISQLFPDFTRNFRGYPLKLAIPKAPFRFELEMREDGRYNPKRGTYKPWLDTAMSKFNFTYNCFYSSYGGGTGIKFDNGTWVGAVADVKDNVADIAFFIAHIYNRHEVVDWSAPLSYEWIVFVSHKPKFYYSFWAILWPFDVMIWMLFLLSIFCVALCVKMISSKLAELTASKRITNLWTLSKSLEYIFTTFVEQDRQGPSALPFNSIRTLCVSWLLFALVTATAYRAKLVSVMAFPVSSFVPTTYEELVDSHFGAGMHVIGKGDAAYTIFQKGRGRVYEGIFARLETGFSSPLQCLLKAVHEDFGCLMWEGLNDYLNVRNISHGMGRVPTQVSQTKTSFINDGLIYERRAIIRKHLDDSIRAARDTGLTKKWVSIDFAQVRKARMDWERSLLSPHQKYLKHNVEEENGPKSLSLDNCASTIVILLAGIFMSGLVFAIEWVSNINVLLDKTKRKVKRVIIDVFEQW